MQNCERYSNKCLDGECPDCDNYYIQDTKRVYKMLWFIMITMLIIASICAILNLSGQRAKTTATNTQPIHITTVSTVMPKYTQPKPTNKTKIKIVATAYCNCKRCCGINATRNYGITASGKRTGRGTIAAPKNLPFGTNILIKGKVYSVQDRGNRITYRNGVYRIDIWFPTHKEAKKFGVQKLTGEILK